MAKAKRPAPKTALEKNQAKPKRKYTRRTARVEVTRTIRRMSVAELETENTRLNEKIRTLEGVILLIHRAA
jgi:hypothetical protein